VSSKHCTQLAINSSGAPYCFCCFPLRAHADEATAKNISSAHLVHDDISQTSRDDLMKRLQLLAEQEAKFIADMKYVLTWKFLSYFACRLLL
jgi:hypothetical protein